MADEERVLAGRYRLRELLGRGGVADVHRATDEVLARDVALKLLREKTDDPADRARFEAEARTLARLNHPGVVAVLDAGVDGDLPYLVLELVVGRTLADDLPGPLGEDEVARVGREVAAGLAHAHAAGVVHRDVKPANVLRGEDGRSRLTDFGIARLVADTVRHTRTGFTVGTAAYLSPEQVRGEEVTAATDVYALGLVLLEALTGERAYPGSLAESATARLHTPPVVPDHLGAPWRDLLPAMTALDPSARPGAARVAQVLEGTADTRLLTSVVPARPVVPVPWWRRPIVLAAAAVAAVLMVLGAWWVGTAAQDAGSDVGEETPAQTPAQSPSPTPTPEPAGSTDAGSSSPSESPSESPSDPAEPQQKGPGKPEKQDKGNSGPGKAKGKGPKG